jgi:DNA primase
VRIRRQLHRRFGDEELYNVRNRIPIRHIIENLLAIPSETVHGVFRFRCPLCAGRHTAIKPETNLARCFDCGKNFNAIDLCILVKHTDFVESVKFLIGYKSRFPEEVRATSESHRNYLEPPTEGIEKPVALSGILAKLIGKCLEEGQKDANRETAPQRSLSPDDIAELERIVQALSQILQRLKSNHHNPA